MEKEDSQQDIILLVILRYIAAGALSILPLIFYEYTKD